MNLDQALPALEASLRLTSRRIVCTYRRKVFDSKLDDRWRGGHTIWSATIAMYTVGILSFVAESLYWQSVSQATAASTSTTRTTLQTTLEQ